MKQKTHLKPEVQLAIQADLIIRSKVNQYMAARKPDYLAALYSVSDMTIRQERNGAGKCALMNYEREAVRIANIEFDGMKPLARRYTLDAIAERIGVSRRTVMRYRDRMIAKKEMPRPLINEVAA